MIVTNYFCILFCRWLDKLGLAARLNHDVVMRQTFVVGQYALVDYNLEPNPVSNSLIDETRKSLKELVITRVVEKLSYYYQAEHSFRYPDIVTGQCWKVFLIFALGLLAIFVAQAACRSKSLRCERRNRREADHSSLCPLFKQVLYYCMAMVVPRENAL